MVPPRAAQPCGCSRSLPYSLPSSGSPPCPSAGSTAALRPKRSPQSSADVQTILAVAGFARIRPTPARLSSPQRGLQLPNRVVYFASLVRQANSRLLRDQLLNSPMRRYHRAVTTASKILPDLAPRRACVLP